jgi:hypothetical protein
MTCGCTHEKELHNHGTDFCKVEGCWCHEFISDIKEWKKAKFRWDWEDAEDSRLENEAFTQDNDESSGWTDLGNRGGTTFCY